MEPNPFDEFDEEVNPFDEFDQVDQTAELPSDNTPQPVEDLPAPSDSMFSQMNDGEAKAVFEAYSKHPKASRDEQGNLLYNGQVVPPTEGNSGLVDAVVQAGANVLNPVGAIGNLIGEGYDAVMGPTAEEDKGLLRQTAETSRDFDEGLVGGAVNAVKNTVETAAAVGTYSPILAAVNYVTGDDIANPVADAAVSGVDAVMPEFNPEGTAEGLGSLAGEVGAGIIAGNKVAAAAKAAGATAEVAASLADKMPKVANFFARLATASTGQAAGVAATVDADSDTAVVGPDAIIPVMAGLDGVSESEAQSVVEKRFNIFMDNMVLAGPIDLIADGGRWVFGTAWDAIGKPIQGTFLDGSGKVKESVAFQAFHDALRNGIDPQNPNSATADEYVAKVIELLKNEEEAVIVFPELKGKDFIGPRGQKRVELDTSAIIQRGLADDPSDAAANVRTFFKRKHREVLDSPGVQQTQNAAERPVRALEQQTQEGYDAFGGAEGIEKAKKGVQESGKSEVDRAFAEAEDADFDLGKTKERYGQILTEDEGLGPRLLAAANEPGSRIGVDRDKITGDIVESIRTGNKNIAAARKTKWDNIPEGLPVNEVELNDAIEAAKGHLDSSSRKAFKDAGVDLDGLSDEADSAVDFALLQRKLRSPLNAAINRAKTTGQGYEELLAVKKNITDLQPEWLAGRKGKKAQKAVKALDEAVTFDKEVVGTTSGTGIPKKIKEIDKGAGLDKVKADQETYELIEKSVRSKSSPAIKHLADTLADPNYGGKHGLIVDHALANVAEDMADTLAVDGVSGINVKSILSSLKPFRTALNSNPKKFAKELKRLDEFQEKLVANSKDAGRLKELASKFASDAEKKRKDVYEDALKEFFTKQGRPVPSGEKAFKDAFLNPQGTSKEAAGRVDDIIARMDPAAREGASAAWYDILKKEAFNPDGTLNTTKVAQMISGDNNILIVGRKVLGPENEKLVDVIEQLLEPSLGFQISKKAPSIKSAESAVSEASAKRAANRLVLATKGPLTKFGGRVTSLVGTVLDVIKPDEANARIADAMMADRKEFLRMFNDFAKSKTGSKESYRKVFNWAVKMGIYNDSQSWDKWWKEVSRLNTEAETEENFPPARKVY